MRSYPEPVRLDVNVDAYVPADYIPYEQAKVDVHRRIAGAREIAELMELRAELEDRFGELPEPLDNLITLQQARIKLGQAGATNGQLPAGPAGGHADRARRGDGAPLREILPGANYEAGRSPALTAGARRPRSALSRGGARRRRTAGCPGCCLKFREKIGGYPEAAATMRSREKVNFQLRRRPSPGP